MCPNYPIQAEHLLALPGTVGVYHGAPPATVSMGAGIAPGAGETRQEDLSQRRLVQLSPGGRAAPARTLRHSRPRPPHQRPTRCQIGRTGLSVKGKLLLRAVWHSILPWQAWAARTTSCLVWQRRGGASRPMIQGGRIKRVRDRARRAPANIGVARMLRGFSQDRRAFRMAGRTRGPARQFASLYLPDRTPDGHPGSRTARPRRHTGARFFIDL
jgi:hypothetical protein